eukprot:10312882-Alexandrium_andersonii.AAC.1
MHARAVFRLAPQGPKANTGLKGKLTQIVYELSAFAPVHKCLRFANQRQRNALMRASVCVRVRVQARARACRRVNACTRVREHACARMRAHALACLRACVFARLLARSCPCA